MKGKEDRSNIILGSALGEAMLVQTAKEYNFDGQIVDVKVGFDHFLVSL